MKIMSYTRLPLEDAVYANRLAYSMHLAYLREDGSWAALNHNSGILFVKATENEDGSLNPKSLKTPWLFSMKEGGYGVFAVRTQAEGEADSEDPGTVTFWTTQNLLAYKEEGQFAVPGAGSKNPEDVRCCYDGERDRYRFQWKDASGNWWEILCSRPELWQFEENSRRIDEKEVIGLPAENTDGIQGAVVRSIVEISDQLGEYLKKKLLPAENIGVEIPEEIEAKNKCEVLSCYAQALYSDGSKVPRKILWDVADLEKINFARAGRYPLKGKIYQPHFAFPIAVNRADPCVFRWNGKYYFIATNDADGNHTLYMRGADSLEELKDAKEHLILDSDTYEDIGGLLWAPEFHEIDGRLYLFHAATPEPFFYEESHLMQLREGGNPLDREDWSRPRRIVKQDGSDLCEAGKEITLDMTEFEWQGELYVIWSQRQFLPKDLGAWLYIAKLNRKEPWKLASEPVVLSKPEYGWANNHTFVDEGPFALIRGEKLYVTFSSAAVDSTYVVGLLQIGKGLDLLKPENWRKTNYPLFTSRSLEGEYGTGHNAYVCDEDGLVWNTYHARPGVDGPRSTGFRRVHFDVDGEPMLDVTEELDLKPEYADVETVVVVQRKAAAESGSDE